MTETSYAVEVQTLEQREFADAQPYWQGNVALRVPTAWVARLIQCGMTTLGSVEAASDGALAKALGVTADVVPEVRAAVVTLREARAKAEKDRDRAKEAADRAWAEQQERRRQEAEEEQKRRTQWAEAAAARAAEEAAAAAVVAREKAAAEAKARAEAAAERARRQAEWAAKREADAAAERARRADAIAQRDTRPSVFDYAYRWPPGPSQFDNIGLSPRLHAIVRRAGWVSLAAIRNENDSNLVFRTEKLGVVGLREIRRLIGYNEIDRLGLRVAVANALRRGPFTTRAAIAHATDQELLRTPNFGRVALRQLRRAVPYLWPAPPPPALESMATGDIEAAIAAELAPRRPPRQPPWTEIDYIELSVRAANGLRNNGMRTLLRNNGMRTLEDVERISDRELARHRVERARRRAAASIWPERARP